MRVLLFEPKYVGHFLGFAAVTARAFADLGCEVTMLVPSRAKGTTQADIKLGSLPENVRVRYEIDVPKLYKKWENAEFETAALELALERYPTDHLVMPSGDFVLAGLMKHGSLRRRVKAIGGTDLVMHSCQQVYPELGIRQRTLCYLDRLAVSMANGIRLLTVDPYATSEASVSHMALYGNPVLPLPHFREIPEYHPSKSQARIELGLPENGRLLGSVGDLGRRKGTELLIESFARSQPGPDDYLVLFGILSGTAREMLKQNQDLIDEGSIIVRDRFVTDSEFLNFFDAMDAVWCGCPHQVGIASTQLFAAEANRPIISTRYGAIGWLTEEYGLGRTFPGTVSAMARAIAWFLKTDDWTPDPHGRDRLLSYHTTENFNKHVTAGIRARMPASVSPSQHVLTEAVQ